jgi:NADH-ubiquinone oxidoreductase chain 4L
MTLSLVLFLVGVLGFSLNRRNLLMLLISIELMLLGVTLMVLTSAHDFNDSTGHTFAILIVATAGAESAIGLGVLVAYYRLRGTLTLPV